MACKLFRVLDDNSHKSHKSQLVLVDTITEKSGKRLILLVEYDTTKGGVGSI